jgi:polyribonucleotide nucleotidyltransferase
VEPETDEVSLDEVNAYSTEDVSAAFKRQASKTMRRLLLDEGLRSDGRAPSDVRPIWSAAGILPKVRYSGATVANRNAKVWHGATETGR